MAIVPPVANVTMAVLEIRMLWAAGSETVPVTTAVTVPVATTTRPVAVAVNPDDAVVKTAFDTKTVPETTVVLSPVLTVKVVGEIVTVPLTTAETLRPGTTETT